MAKSTKIKILQCFSDLLGKYELDKITITMLVNECNISRQTFYYHFSDIQSLINWGIRQETAGCLESVKNAHNIHTATSIYLNYIEKNRIFLTKCMESSLSGYTTVLLRKSVEEYISFFTYHVLKLKKSPECDADFIIEFISNSIIGFIIFSIYRKKEMNVADITDRMNKTVFSRLVKCSNSGSKPKAETGTVV